MMISSGVPKFASNADVAKAQPLPVVFGHDAFTPHATATQFGMKRNLFLGTALAGLFLLTGCGGKNQGAKVPELTELQKLEAGLCSMNGEQKLQYNRMEKILVAGSTRLRTQVDSMKNAVKTIEDHILDIEARKKSLYEAKERACNTGNTVALDSILRKGRETLDR